MFKSITRLNTVLIILSMILAYFLPFELFLFSYAVLGPLHYLTEINWINDQNYFLPNNQSKWRKIILIFAFVYAIPFLFKLSLFQDYHQSQIGNFILTKLHLYTNGFLFSGFIIAVALTTFKNKWVQLAMIGLGFLLAIALRDLSGYQILMGAYIPTIIHVYLFTLLFMIYGNIKSKAKFWSTNVVLMLLVPLIIYMVTIFPNTNYFNEYIVQMTVDSGFHNLIAVISNELGTDFSNFNFYSPLSIKIQMFVSFAYTYHYLNWFSKTTIIGWHKKLTQKKSIIFLTLWILSLLLYGYDYKTGLSLLVFLSILHVLLEFPLNVVTIKEIGAFIWKKPFRN